MAGSASVADSGFAFPSFPIGFGVFPLTGEARPGYDESLTVIHAALDAGVRFLDTADSYQPVGGEVGFGETLVVDALRSWRGGDPSEVVVGTKGSRILLPNGERVSNGDPAYLRAACRASLARLAPRSGALDLYQLHRPDPAVPYEDSLGALAELYDQGLVRAVGISNANPAQIAVAVETLGRRLVSVQNQFGPGFLSSEPELELCASLGLAFLPWSAFGGADPEVALPVTFPVLGEIAAAHGVSWYRVVVAWMLAKPGRVLPIPGARRVESIVDTIAGASLELSPDELARIESALHPERTA
ncbi:aldo/keto reductase [Herbiconiux moechotypicola]|uniref:Aldo/keto reductase n=1 Tax=Herbiconiux moechotypicola TaxID=637393 RepID=A0ABP5Q755_9MICO|nr:aldo/keto reductase [Herbiconiux moechotypicola]MCS5729132.1 aldo/keto reductase [Herbiconiux moechotypicola]